MFYYSIWIIIEVTRIFINVFDEHNEDHVAEHRGEKDIPTIESILVLTCSIGLGIVLIISLQRIRSHTKTLMA